MDRELRFLVRVYAVGDPTRAVHESCVRRQYRAARWVTDVVRPGMRATGKLPHISGFIARDVINSGDFAALGWLDATWPGICEATLEQHHVPHIATLRWIWRHSSSVYTSGARGNQLIHNIFCDTTCVETLRWIMGKFSAPLDELLDDETADAGLIPVALNEALKRGAHISPRTFRAMLMAAMNTNNLWLVKFVTRTAKKRLGPLSLPHQEVGVHFTVRMLQWVHAHHGIARETIERLRRQGHPAPKAWALSVPD